MEQNKYDCINYHNTTQKHLTCTVCKDGEIIYKPCLLDLNYTECPDFEKVR